MLQRVQHRTDLENISTWIKYSKKLCDSCVGSCCNLPVEVKAKDLIRIGLMDEFEIDENLKFIAKRLMKEGLVDHFHSKSATFTLSRMANGNCIYLDNTTHRCTIYNSRPDTCRNHPHIGPRSGYCAYKQI